MARHLAGRLLWAVAFALALALPLEVRGRVGPVRSVQVGLVVMSGAGIPSLLFEPRPSG